MVWSGVEIQLCACTLTDDELMGMFSMCMKHVSNVGVKNKCALVRLGLQSSLITACCLSSENPHCSLHITTCRNVQLPCCCSGLLNQRYAAPWLSHPAANLPPTHCHGKDRSITLVHAVG